MTPERKRHACLWAAASLLALSLFFIQSGRDLETKSLLKPFKDFPVALGKWRAVGADKKLDARTLAILGPQDYLLRNYVGPRGGAAALFLAYFGLQKQPHMIHSPRHCMPGAGWQIARRESVPVVAAGREYRVNRMLLTNGVERLSVLYWYQGRGRVQDNEYLDRLNLIWDGIFRHRSDGALVRLSQVVRPGPGGGDPLASQVRLAELIIPALNGFLP